jgi:hypothetical protein
MLETGELFRKRLPGGVWGWLPAAVLLPLSAIALCCAGCGGGDSSRVPLHGSVRVDRQAAERMLVQLHYRGASEAGQSPEVEGNDKYPLGLTDEAGRFQIGDDGTRAGVLPGRYAVTFTWLSSDGLDAKDKFGGRYANAERSEHLIDVPQDIVGPLEFELTSR